MFNKQQRTAIAMILANATLGFRKTKKTFLSYGDIPDPKDFTGFFEPYAPRACWAGAMMYGNWLVEHPNDQFFGVLNTLPNPFEGLPALDRTQLEAIAEQLTTADTKFWRDYKLNRNMVRTHAEACEHLVLNYTDSTIMFVGIALNDEFHITRERINKILENALLSAGTSHRLGGGSK